VAFGEDLVAAILFGSAAEGRLRPVSDVNLLLVLERFDAPRADGIRTAFRTAHALIHLEVMFLLRSELSDALDAFGVKFADILTRRRVLHGVDVFAGLTVQAAAIRARLLQVLLNLALRLRERYVHVSLREEQLAPLIADSAGPLRASAAALLRLEGRPASAPREALERVVAESGLPEGLALLKLVSRSREQGALAPGEGPRVLLFLIEIAQHLRGRALALAPRPGAERPS
jgi:hypothetical protein